MSLEQLARIEDRFTLEKVIGRGRFSFVWRARYLQEPNIFVALKEIDPSLWGSTENIGRKDLDLATREVASWEVINGSSFFPQFLGAYEACGKTYIALELLERTLQQELAQRVHGAKGAYSSSNAKEVLLDVARALKVIHDLGYLHRDISSSNVLVAKSGERKLGDIGVMREIDEVQNSSTHIHTPGYAAPETLAAIYSVQSDLYALGALWVELVSARSPKQFVPTDLRSSYTVKYEMSDPSDNSMLQKLLAPSAQDRPANVDEVIDYLEQRQQGVVSQIPATTVSSAQFVSSSGKLSPWDVPEVEATIFAQNVVLDPNLSNDQKIRKLNFYLGGNPVSERDHRVVQQVMYLLTCWIRVDESRFNIVTDYLRQAAIHDPELIFGYRRAQIAAAYTELGFAKLDPLPKFVEEIAKNTLFCSLVEKMNDVSDGLTLLRTIYDAALDASNVKDTTYDKAALKRKLENKIPKGSSVNAVVLQSVVAEDASTLFEDPKMLTLAQTIHENEDLAPSNWSHPDVDCFRLSGGFGKDLIGYEGIFDPSPQSLIYTTTGMIGGLFAGVVGMGVSLLSTLIGYPIPGDMTTVMLSSAGAGAITTGPVAALANKVSRMVTKNTFYGEVQRHYSRTKVLGYLNDVLDQLPQEKYHSIPEEVERIGVETKNTLTPYEVLDMTLDRMKEREETRHASVYYPRDRYYPRDKNGRVLLK